MTEDYSAFKHKAIREHTQKARRIGEQWYPYLETLAEHSNVPVEFDALLRHRLEKTLEHSTTIDHVHRHWRDTTFRLTGMDFSNEIAAKHAMSYGQAISIIKILEGKDNPDDDLSKVLSSYKFTPSRSLALEACCHFAEPLENFEMGFVNPEMSHRIKRQTKLMMLRLKGDFNSHKIISSVEEQFSKLSVIRKIQADFNLLFGR